MTDTEKYAKLIAVTISELRILAARSTRYEMSEDYDPSEGGNYDDVYRAGHEDGRTELARDILDMIKALST